LRFFSCFGYLQEKNLLLTDRANKSTTRGWSGSGRLRKVKEGMARVKTVLKERAIVFKDTKKRLEARHAQWKDEQKVAQSKA
jgi:hypothetical protein